MSEHMHPHALPTSRAPTSPTKLAVSVEEAAEISSLGRSTLYELMTAGRLPFVKLGNRRLLLVRDLEALLAAHRSKPSPG